MDSISEHNILTIVDCSVSPLAGMIVLLFFNKENKTLIKVWANIVGVVGFLISFRCGCGLISTRRSVPVRPASTLDSVARRRIPRRY